MQARFEGRYQALFSLFLLGLIIGTCATIDLLARNRALERWLTAEQYETAKKTNRLFSYTGNFIDYEERVLLDEIPNADYSQGGIFFFGTSNMKWAFQTWNLHANEKHFIGNYGIGASNHTIQLQLIRYLIEHRGFLSAGDRDLVIFGVSFHLGHVDPPGSSYFDALLRRQGLFTLTPEGRTAPTPMSNIERRLRIEKARSAGLFWNAWRVIKGRIEVLEGSVHRSAHDPTPYVGFMGPHWQQNIDTEVEQFRKTILLVRSYGAVVKVILLPQGSWMDTLPFKSYYESKIRSLCESTSTPLMDLSRSLPDGDFVDLNHLTVQGQEEFRRLIADEINEHMHKLEAETGSR